MRTLFLLTAAATLAGCHGGNDAANQTALADQPNESVVLAQMENAQDAIDDEIANDAGDPGGSDANDGADDPATADAYRCDNGWQVSVTYGQDDNTARLTAQGKTLALLGVPAASGSKYHSDEGLSPGKSLTWWIKGDDAMLIETPSAGGGKETTVHCHDTD